MESAVDSQAVPPSVGGIYDTANQAKTISPDGRYYPYPYPNPEVPITDTREFLKISYNAGMQTRDVQGLTRRAETTIRGYEGRIDQISSSKDYGYINFAISQSKYEAFRDEFEGLVGKRFLTVNISSQNLLSQKVSIEEQEKQAGETLADYQTARQKLVSTHASTVKSLQTQIAATTEQLVALRALTETPEIAAEIKAVSDEVASLKSRLARENANYSVQLSSADARIKSIQDWQKAIATQDQKFLDNIATVNGTVSIQWISLWAIALLYLPGFWIPAIFAVLSVLSYLRDRKRAVIR